MHVISCLQKQGQLRTIVHWLLKQLCLEDAWNVILQLRLFSRDMYEAADQQSSLFKKIEAEVAQDVQAIGLRAIMNFLSWHVVRTPSATRGHDDHPIGPSLFHSSKLLGLTC
jgi:hypothetical protein